MGDAAYLDALVNAGRGQYAVVVLAPVGGQHLEAVRRQHQGGPGLAQVPNANGAVAAG